MRPLALYHKDFAWDTIMNVWRTVSPVHLRVVLIIERVIRHSENRIFAPTFAFFFASKSAKIGSVGYVESPGPGLGFDDFLLPDKRCIIPGSKPW